MLWWKPAKHWEYLAGEPQINHQWSAPHKETLWSLETLVGGGVRYRVEKQVSSQGMWRKHRHPQSPYTNHHSMHHSSQQSTNLSSADWLQHWRVRGGHIGCHCWTWADAPQAHCWPCCLQDQPAQPPFSLSAVHTTQSRDTSATWAGYTIATFPEAQVTILPRT